MKNESGDRNERSAARICVEDNADGIQALRGVNMNVESGSFITLKGRSGSGKTTRELLTFFRELVESRHITMLMVSHDPLVDQYVHQVLTLKDGVIAEST